MGDSGRRYKKVGYDQREREILETNFEMIDIDAIKPENNHQKQNGRNCGENLPSYPLSTIFSTKNS